MTTEVSFPPKGVPYLDLYASETHETVLRDAIKDYDQILLDGTFPADDSYSSSRDGICDQREWCVSALIVMMHPNIEQISSELDGDKLTPYWACPDCLMVRMTPEIEDFTMVKCS